MLQIHPHTFLFGRSSISFVATMSGKNSPFSVPLCRLSPLFVPDTAITWLADDIYWSPTSAVSYNIEIVSMIGLARFIMT
jgi:hypothetical protein